MMKIKYAFVLGRRKYNLPPHNNNNNNNIINNIIMHKTLE